MTQALFGDGGFHSDFSLSITKALGDQLAASLQRLKPASLAEENLALLREKPGVYQLFLRDEFVYVGKADKSLPSRLRQHLRKISGRKNISISDMSFSCLYVAEDFSALAPEQLLISHHKGEGQLAWNTNGFGNKDPGKERDNTRIKRNHFDLLFPIDLDRVVKPLSAGEHALDELLVKVKASLPYNFRYGSVDGTAQTVVSVPDDDPTAHDLFKAISASLPEWQITALMGYVIMYKEHKDYDSAWRMYRDGKSTDKKPTVSNSETA